MATQVELQPFPVADPGNDFVDAFPVVRRALEPELPQEDRQRVDVHREHVGLLRVFVVVEHLRRLETKTKEKLKRRKIIKEIKGSKRTRSYLLE